MTEAEWLTCTDPQPMVEFLADKVNGRKVRLFGCACCRRIWGFLTNIHSREAVEAAEQFADGLITRRGLEWAAGRAARVESYSDSSRLAARLARIRLEGTMEEAIRRVGAYNTISILHDLFNPFCSAPATWFSILAWNDSTVVRVARAIYDERAFDRMPILADALEDAGCDNADLLAHCRGPNEHVRGCWVVDLLLGKQ